MGRKLQPLIEQLRRAILNADVCRYLIATETGLTEAGLSLENIDKIGNYLRLEITTPNKTLRTRKGK